MSKDYYKVLGIERSASEDDIKHAYRDLAMKLHPDRNKSKDAEEKFKEINEAYAVLSNPEKRRQYDVMGSTQFNQNFSQEDIFRGFDIDEVFKMFNQGDMQNLFSMTNLGGFQATRRMDVGNDILERIEVSQKDADDGAEKRIRVMHTKLCSECKGSGAEKGSTTIVCDVCKGRGQVKQTLKIPFGIMETVLPCQKCGGAGKTVDKICRVCRGHGRLQASDNVVMKVPAGITSGSRLRLAGLGDYGRDKTGDLYVDIFIRGDRDSPKRGIFGGF